MGWECYIDHLVGWGGVLFYIFYCMCFPIKVVVSEDFLLTKLSERGAEFSPLSGVVCTSACSLQDECKQGGAGLDGL